MAGNGSPGFSGDGGPATLAAFRLNVTGCDVVSLAKDRSGSLLIPDCGNHRLRRVDATTGVVSTIAGDGRNDSTGDGGPAAAASLARPNGVAVGPEGDLFVAELGVDWGPGRVRRIAATNGQITTVAGGGSEAPAAGIPATSAALGPVVSVSVDPDADLWLSTGNQVWEVPRATGLLRLIAGSAEPRGSDS